MQSDSRESVCGLDRGMERHKISQKVQSHEDGTHGNEMEPVYVNKTNRIADLSGVLKQ